MTTRTGDLWQRQRRRSRQALALIPDMTSLTVSLGSPVASPNTLNNEMRDRMSPWHPGIATSSPDELVIRKRGRRSKTIIWSPEADSKRNSLLSYSFQDRTPTKADSDLRSPFVLREHMAIRKRLDLSEDYGESMLTTPEKKQRIPYHESLFNGNNVVNGLKGLSHEQLIKVIMDLVSLQEQGSLSLNNTLRDVITKLIPPSDINPHLERLRVLRKNIYDSLVSSNNSSCGCAYLHLDAFWKTLKEQGTTLMQSQHWVSLMDYVFASWSITKDLPAYDEENIARKCFSHLIQFCKQALINGNFTHSALEVYAEKMEAMIHDYEDMNVCLQMAREILR